MEKGLVAALKQCGRSQDLEKGRNLHRDAQASSQTNKYVASVLIRMYSKCRRMALAKQVFDEVRQRDAGIWNSLILGYLENGESSLALELFKNMDCEPSAVTCIIGLKVCSAVASERQSEMERCLETGVEIHRQAEFRGFDLEVTVANSLLNMYCICRRIQLAKEVFDSMPQRNAASWNCLILGYSKNGECLMAMELFSCMPCEPDSYTYVAVLKACSGLATVESQDSSLWLGRGIAIHKKLQCCGLESHSVVMNALLDMYCKFRSMQQAREVFDRMKKRTTVSWNSLMLGYVENGEPLIALDLFTIMSCESPSSVTYIVVLKAIASLASKEDKRLCLQRGIEVHKQLKQSGLETDSSVAASLVDMYSKCGSMRLARDAFDSMPQHNAVAWTCLIQGYLENGENLVAIRLFSSMHCKPTLVTYVAVLKACGGLARECESMKQFSLQTGLAIHEELRASGFDSDVVVATTLIDMYSKCGKMNHAREIFDEMDRRNSVTWNCLILGYVGNGESTQALEAFAAMDCEPDCGTYVAALRACAGVACDKELSKERGFEIGIQIHRQLRASGFDSDLTVATTLIDMYSKCGIMESAKEVFDTMRQKNVVSWTSLIMGYVGNGENVRSLEMFVSMNCEPNRVTYVAVLKACGNLVSPFGKCIHARVCKLGLEEEQIVANSLIDYYVKCGALSRGESLLESMNHPDTVSWNSLIAGYSSLGNFCRVFGLAKEMQENRVKMDGVTYLCVLAACSHAGLVAEGRIWFEAMSRAGVRVSLEHCNCMLDMLSRADKIEEALDFIAAMPLDADDVTWMTLLGSCRERSSLKVGEVAFNALMSAGTREAAPYVLMRNLVDLSGGHAHETVQL